MKLLGISVDQVKLKAFLFSLADSVKEWLYYLPFGTIDTWVAMKKYFLEKYFFASKATSIRKEIYAIRQDVEDESLYNYRKGLNGYVPRVPTTKLVSSS